MMLGRLMGFDARIAVDSVTKYWDAGRRTTFLLNQGAERPLSVDPMVWPSLFDLGHGIGFSPEERARLGLAGGRGANSALPEWIGPNRPLWEDLGALRGHLQATANGSLACVLIAVTLCSEGKTSPALNQKWERLGHDVADSSFISGLSNCGYTAEEAGKLRPRWSSQLNEHHLFANPGDALQFARLAGRRVPEHAPFYVYGLYQVEAL